MDVEVSNHASYQIPRELMGPLPRNVRMRAGKKSALVFLTYGILVAGVVFVTWNVFNAVQQFKLRTALRSGGQTTTGTVSLAIYTRLVTTVHYTFVVNGVGYSGRSDIPDTVQVNKSDPISIRYLPSNPAMNHPAGWEWSLSDELSPVTVAVFFIAMIGRVSINLRRERRVARGGVPALGVVQSCARGRNGLRAKYAFRTERGEQIVGSSYCNYDFQPGQGIWILYLPGNPSKNGCYPLSDYDIVG